MVRPVPFTICLFFGVPIIAVFAIGDGLKYMVSDQPNGPKIVLWHHKPEVAEFCPIWGDGPCHTVYR